MKRKKIGNKIPTKEVIDQKVYFGNASLIVWVCLRVCVNIFREYRIDSLQLAAPSVWWNLRYFHRSSWEFRKSTSIVIRECPCERFCIVSMDSFCIFSFIRFIRLPAKKTSARFLSSCLEFKYFSNFFLNECMRRSYSLSDDYAVFVSESTTQLVYICLPCHGIFPIYSAFSCALSLSHFRYQGYQPEWQQLTEF